MQNLSEEINNLEGAGLTANVWVSATKYDGMAMTDSQIWISNDIALLESGIGNREQGTIDYQRVSGFITVRALCFDCYTNKLSGYSTFSANIAETPNPIMVKPEPMKPMITISGVGKARV